MTTAQTASATLVVATIVMGSLLHTNIRMQKTLLGYDIGQLKSEEARLLKQRALLTMKLAKLTTRKKLEERLDLVRKRKAQSNEKQFHQKRKG